MQRKLFIAALVLSVVGLGLAGCAGHDPVLPNPSVPTIQPQPTTTTPEPPVTTDPTTTTRPPAAQVDPVCEGSKRWTTEPKERDTSSSADLYKVRFAPHASCDRVVFVVDGPAAVGYHVEYVPQPTYDGSGAPLYVKGQAFLQVVIRAGLEGVDPPGPLAFQTSQWLLQDGLNKGYKSLQSIRYANFYEGQSNIGIGVAVEGLKFRVQMFPGENGGDTRVVIDIAHP